jgi:SAM-dependent methyltransferase
MAGPVVLRPVRTGTLPCKICGGNSVLFDVADFHKSCEENRGLYFARTGVAVYYRRCMVCGFIFTDAFDDWTPEIFHSLIYNDNYIKVDPDYLDGRPRGNAGWLGKMFEPHREWLRVLDWGGGSGLLAALLREAGYAHADTYDPFTPAFATPRTETFNLVTSFETLEHLPDPMGGIAAMAARVAEPGLAFFSTLLQPPDIEKQRINWWYAAPRNGHVSLFSKNALARAWQAQGFQVTSLSDVLHIAYRQLPDFFPRQAQSA